METPRPEQDKKTGRFISGNIGGGRPKGARNKLGEDFLQKLQADFEEHGVDAIEKVRTDKPDAYLKVIASLLPKDLNVNFNPAEEMTDDELRDRIRQLESTIRPFLASEGISGPTDGSEQTTAH